MAQPVTSLTHLNASGTRIAFELDSDLRAYAEALSMGARLEHFLETEYDGCASDAPIIFMSADRQGFDVGWARWGLVPQWHVGKMKDWTTTRPWSSLDDMDGATRHIRTWRYHHCLIPVTGYTVSSSGGQHRFQTCRQNGERLDGERLAVAGLWHNVVQGGTSSRNFTMLTRAVGTDATLLQDQEPVILSQEEWWAWLVHRTVADLRNRLPGVRSDRGETGQARLIGEPISRRCA